MKWPNEAFVCSQALQKLLQYVWNSKTHFVKHKYIIPEEFQHTYYIHIVS